MALSWATATVACWRLLIETNPVQRLLWRDHVIDRNTTTTKASRQWRPEHRHVVLWGDSITRYQYLSLVYYLHAGRWMPDDQSGLFRDWKGESGWAGDWNAFFNYTNSLFEGHEQCDCSRAPPQHVKSMYENRYYADPAHNLYVTYLQKMGDAQSHGHLDAATVYATNNTGNRIFVDRGPGRRETYRWRGDWLRALRDHILQLQPKPDYVVFNAGLWPPGLNADNLSEMASLLQQHNVTGIYKTTTRTELQNDTASEPHDVLGCHYLPYCFNLSWTGRLHGADHYADPTHFTPQINRQFNELFLDLLQQIEQEKARASSSTARQLGSELQWQ